MSVNTLEKLLIDELKDLYSAERQITRALPKIAKATTSEELKSALENHLQETEGQIERLDKIGQILGKSLKGKTCDGMKGVLTEGASVLEEVAEGNVRDAGIISAAQRVEHYEIAAYGSARTFAQTLGHSQAVELLEQTLQEEKTADHKLTQLAQQMVNHEALRSGAVAHR